MIVCCSDRDRLNRVYHLVAIQPVGVLVRLGWLESWKRKERERERKDLVARRAGNELL